MFQRYNESARRTIFFARYEASQYGSPSIETEHLLLGLLREDRQLAKTFLGHGNVEPAIRAEIERHIERHERILTSIEMPLSGECKRILNMAAEESERLGHRHVGTEHLLLGLLREEKSLAATLLRERGLSTVAVREALAKTQGAERCVSSEEKYQEMPKAVLDNFLVALKWNNSDQLIEFFAENAQFIDVFGKRWNRDETLKNFETLFAPYAKKNAAPLIEEPLTNTADLFIATVLWKNAILASLQRVWIHRMSIVMILDDGDWRILLMHVTPVQGAAGHASQSG